MCIIKTSMGNIVIELFKDKAPMTVQNFIELAEGKREFMDPKTRKKGMRPFYDNLIFHRVIKGFMIQGGCPLGNGTGSPGYQFKDEINATHLGLDKIKVVQADGSYHPNLLIRSQDDFYKTIYSPMLKKMKITSNPEFKKRKKEIDEKLSKLTLKACYENLGYHYSDTLKSEPLTRGVIAMANSGPNTNGSQFFINLVDTPWLMGKHTVFGKVIKGMDVIDKIGQAPVGAGSKPTKGIKIISIRERKTLNP